MNANAGTGQQDQFTFLNTAPSGLPLEVRVEATRGETTYLATAPVGTDEAASLVEIFGVLVTGEEPEPQDEPEPEPEHAVSDLHWRAR